MIRVKERAMKNGELYNWLFHFNSHTNVWSAFKREDHSAYWNGTDSKYAIIKSKDIDTIKEIIMRTNGDKTKLNELTLRVRKETSI